VSVCSNAPLLSRFDLVLLLLDVPEKEWDKSVSMFLLKQVLGKNKGVKVEANESKESPQPQPQPLVAAQPQSLLSQSHWDIAVLQQYLAFCRRFHSSVTQSVESQRIIVRSLLNLIVNAM
jgi:DNA replicative helicase MCM subunit Mcm2 (Cdc46/Mcm family)